MVVGAAGRSMPDPITSPTNPRIKALIRLRTRQEREATGRFLIEGELELHRALDGGVTIEEIYTSTTRPSSDIADLAAFSGAKVFDVADEAFRKAAVREGSLLAVARKFDVGLDRIQPGTNPLLLVAASIEKPGNLGAMLRTAAAAGADGVILADSVADLFNPNVIRGSLGAAFLIPTAAATSAETQDWLRSNRIPWLGSSADAARPHWDADMSGPLALVVGSEATGLDAAWRTDDDLLIPTQGSVQSLNTSVSAALLLFEAVRQRRN